MTVRAVAVSLFAAASLAAAPAAPAEPGPTRPATAKHLAVVEHSNPARATRHRGGRTVTTTSGRLYDAGERRVIGRDQSACRSAGDGSFDCVWVLVLKPGKLRLAGNVVPGKDATLDVAGGSGRYRHATGTAVVSRRGNHRFAFRIRLIG